MKKLLIATMVVALAAGAWAEATFSETKVSFDESGTETGRLIPEESTTSGQWECADTEASLTITAYGDDTKYSYSGTGNTRAFSDDQTNYLNIDTGSGKPLWRKFASDGSGVDIGDGYVFDALVQFTGAGEAPAVLKDDKLVIWMQTVDDDEGNKTSTLNVICEANIYDAEQEWFVTSVTNVTLSGNSVAEGDWARLSVKAVKASTTGDGLNGEPLGFVIYIDGVMQSTDAKLFIDNPDAKSAWDANWDDDTKKLLSENKFFCSLIATGSINDSTLTQVGFEGSGKIDDIQIVTAADAPGFTRDTTPVAETVKVTFTAVGLADGVTWTGAGEAKVSKDGSLTKEQIPTTTVDGYTFKGWFEDESCQTAISDLAAMTFSAAKTIYASFAVVAKDPDPVAPGVASATFTT